MLQLLSISAKDSFEVALNLACAALLDGQLQEAQKLLQQAETKGQEVLIEEDATQAVRACPDDCMKGADVAEYTLSPRCIQSSVQFSHARNRLE
jgi:Flp pilus assembly protein TadD